MAILSKKVKNFENNTQLNEQLENMELANSQLRHMMEQKNQQIEQLNQTVLFLEAKIEDLRQEMQVMESEAEAERTFKIEQAEQNTIGKTIYDFLKEDPVKRLKFMSLVSDFEDFEYNYNKLDCVDEMPMNEQVFSSHFYPVIDIYLDSEEESIELKSML